LGVLLYDNNIVAVIFSINIAYILAIFADALYVLKRGSLYFRGTDG
jgi:hypothetical protein